MEVRYHMLRPQQIVERRTACPVAYLPLGCIEWHGFHNALGADALQAEGLAIMSAELGGGLAFPALYYGENRHEALMENWSDDCDKINGGMGLPSGNFAVEQHPFGITEQTLNYNKLLLHILAEIESFGFDLCVMIAGHYPLIDHARAACGQFCQRVFSRKKSMMAWAVTDYMVVHNDFPNAGDHAGIWETSHMMALHPQTVDLGTLPPKGEPLTGVLGTPPYDSTAEFGRRTLETAARNIVREVKHRLEHPETYKGHGGSYLQDMWKKDHAQT